MHLVKWEFTIKINMSLLLRACVDKTIHAIEIYQFPTKEKRFLAQFSVKEATLTAFWDLNIFITLDIF